MIYSTIEFVIEHIIKNNFHIVISQYDGLMNDKICDRIYLSYVGQRLRLYRAYCKTRA